MVRWSAYHKALFLALIVFVADQVSKWIMLLVVDLPAVGSIGVLPFFSFTLVYNKGISMGMALDQVLGRWGLVALMVAITVWLFFWLRKAKTLPEALAVGAIIGGSIGNIVDRLVHGAVVDFLHFHSFGKSFYVFNVADAAISVGVAILVIDSLRSLWKGPKTSNLSVESPDKGEGET